jgi:hypothetical protein
MQKEKHYEKLLEILQKRFEKNMNRHKGLEWRKIQVIVLAGFVDGLRYKIYQFDIIF